MSEGENSHEIHTCNNIFIEGSYSSNSPYYETEGEKYYLGSSNYYVENAGLVTDVFNDRISSINQYYGYSFSINPIVQSRSSTLTPDSTRTYVDSNGYTVVKEAEYFKKLKKFPKNWFGKCGIIALSELLGNYDTFYNDDFIPNNLTYDARYYVKKENLTRSNSDSNFELERTEVEPLISSAKVSYINTGFVSFFHSFKKHLTLEFLWVIIKKLTNGVDLKWLKRRPC